MPSEKCPVCADDSGDCACRIKVVTPTTVREYHCVCRYFNGDHEDDCIAYNQVEVSDAQ